MFDLSCGPGGVLVMRKLIAYKDANMAVREDEGTHLLRTEIAGE